MSASPSRIDDRAVVGGRRILLVVNQDWFFLSHRLPLARAARDHGMDVMVVAGDTGCAQRIRDEGFDFIPMPISRSTINPWGELRTAVFLVRLYRRLRPALVHHSTVKPVVYGSLAAWVTGEAAVVNTISGLGYAFTSTHRTAKTLRPVLRTLWWLALRHPRSRTIFQNADDRGDFIRMGLVRERDTVLVRGSGVD